MHWTSITDCGLQLTLYCRLRTKAPEKEKEFILIEVESDQYKLELDTIDGHPAEDRVHLLLTCDQILQYKFEVAN